MQDLFMYFYQDNFDLNDGNYWWNIIKRDHVSAIKGDTPFLKAFFTNR